MQSAAAGDVYMKTAELSRLKVLNDDLRASVSDSKIVLPDNPLAVVPPGELSKAREELSGRLRDLRDLYSLFRVPEVARSIETLEAQITELKAVEAASYASVFHRSRDALISSLSETKAKELSAERPAKLKAALDRQISIQRQLDPASELSVFLDAGKDAVEAASDLHISRNESSRALAAVQLFLLNHAQWLDTTSVLMAEHATLFPVSSVGPEFTTWWAAKLSTADLEVARRYAVAAAPHGDILEASLDPTTVSRSFFGKVLPALVAEQKRRREGGRQTLSRFDGKVDPSLRDSFLVMLADQRWGRLDRMPPTIRDIVQASTDREDDKRRTEALSLYQELQKVEATAEAAPGEVGPDARRDIDAARSAVEAAMALASVSRDQGGASRQKRSDEENRLAVLLAEMRLNGPDDGNYSPGMPPSPKSPSGGPPPNGNRGPPRSPSHDSGFAQVSPDANFRFRDPVFARFSAEARISLRAAGETVAILKTQSEGSTSNNSQRTMTHAESLRRTDAAPHLVVAEGPRPEVVAKWAGFVNPDTGRPYSPEDVQKGEFMWAIPGGIVLGTAATPQRPIDTSGFVLTYVLRTQRLALVGPRGQVFYSPRVAPQALKALDSFVRSGQTIAASIGYAGNGVQLDRKKGDPVLLDPAFVNTTVGQHLVRADSIPWEFSSAKLDGWENPMASQFKQAEDAFRSRSADDLESVLARPPTRKGLSELRKSVERNNGEVAEMLKACSFSPEFLQFVGKVIAEQYPHLSHSELMQVIEEEILHRDPLATLYVRNATFALQPSRISIETNIEYRYVTAKIEYGDEVRVGKCVSNQVEHIAPLERTVNPRVNDIVHAFPAVRDVQDYGGIAAFLRWARTPGNLQSVDFYSLVQIRDHDPDNTPTPDMILR